MKQHTHHKILLLSMVTIYCLIFSACKKQDDWLNVKRQSSNVVPTTLQDLQAVLDDNNQMNMYYPELVLAGTDNAYIPDATLNGSTISERNSYIWAKDIFQGQPDYDWQDLYTIIEYANVVLDGLSKIDPASADPTAYNNVKGSALFYRSYCFYCLAQIYCKPYDPATANSDLGIPIRLSSDVNIHSVRATLQATYDQITSDVKTAISLLPVTPQATTRPSKGSANALLAKVYLVMQDFVNAGNYANQSLSLNSSLLDYNNTSLVSPTSTYRFPSYSTGNPEIIFFAYGGGYATIEPNGTGNVDTTLYNSYNINDLRKTLFYTKKTNNSIFFFGTYSGVGYNFSGIANDEVFLIRAECFARAGNTSGAMADLNTVLVKRWKTGTFVAYTANSSANALAQILTERRKELPFTGMVRWEDLRRLNKDPLYAVTVTHRYNGTTYTLTPNDNRYVYPIPDIEIQLNGLPQNSR